MLYQQEVSSTAEERRAQTDRNELGENFSKLQQMYGQTASEGSLYELFESFKDMALCS